MSTAAPPSSDVADVRVRKPARRPDGLQIVAALAVAAGIVLRIWPRGALWLDEAQSVAFARRPLASIPSELREDGAPPLYYMVLHLWMRVFGDGDWSVRSLSVAASLAFVAVVVAYAWRAAGPRAAMGVAVIAATTPYALRYATEARMYALVALEVTIGLWAVDLARARPSPPRLAGVALVTAALLYTHYWAVYLAASVLAVLSFAVIVGRRRAAATRPLLLVTGAVIAGGVLWLPWVPSFLFQAEHTGTPWARPSLASVVRITSGASDGGLLPALFVVIGALLALLVRGVAVRGSLPSAGIAAVLVLCPLLAAVGALMSGSAYVSRYASVVFPLAVLLAGIALARIRARAAAATALAVIAVVFSLLGIREARTDRTRAGALTAIVEERVRPGDVLVYCPDQLGPAMSRVIAQRGVDIDERVFPDGAAERVNWIDYEARYSSSTPSVFAKDVLATAAAEGASVWLVWSETYPPTQRRCAGLRRALDSRAVVTINVPDDGSFADHGGIRRYMPRGSSNVRP